MSAEGPGRCLAALLVAAATATAACSVGGGLRVEPLPDPPPTLATTTTDVPPDLSQVALPSARGRTTTTAVVLGPGQANLEGTVVGPTGPVPGAVIRVERMVGETVVSSDLVSADGTWSLPGVRGGQYRIRAWRPPDLAQVEPARLFLGARDKVPVELKLEQFAGPHASPALAPTPAVVDQPVNLVVQVTVRSVDGAGIVRAVPVPVTRVELSASAAWLIRSANVTLTDSTGRARWELLCRVGGVQPVSVVVNGTTTLPLELPACADPPAVAADPVPGAGPSTTTTTTGRPPGTTTTTTTTTRPRP
ncbi:MAG: carboxypeptidase-like regulatory domain-containing protein [Acidimicrobiales bacterium]